MVMAIIAWQLTVFAIESHELGSFTVVLEWPLVVVAGPLGPGARAGRGVEVDAGVGEELELKPAVVVGGDRVNDLLVMEFVLN